jgi:hypothetical protein
MIRPATGVPNDRVGSAAKLVPLLAQSHRERDFIAVGFVPLQGLRDLPSPQK